MKAKICACIFPARPPFYARPRKAHPNMKTAHTIIATLAVNACLMTAAHSATVIAFWDFNDGFDAGDDAVQIAHPASQGSGTLYQQRAEIDGNGKGGITYSNPTIGIDVTDGKAMAWNDVGKSGENDAEFFLQISTVGYENIMIRFDVQGNADSPIVSFDLKFDPNPLDDVTDPPDVTGTIKDFQGGISTSILKNEPFPAGLNDPTYVEQLIDLSAVTDLNDQTTLSIRFDDFVKDNGNDDLRFDNILVTGTPVPEPASALLALLGVAALLQRRKRS